MEENKHEWTCDEVLKGLATTIKGKDYLPTKSYVEPFLNEMSKITSNFKFHVKTPTQITKSFTDEVEMDNITFNRVWVEAILPDKYTIADHEEVIGMVYGLDTRIPIAKFYKGAIRSACTNLCVFNPDMLHVQQLEPEKTIDYSCIRSMLEQTNTVKAFVNKMQETMLLISPDNSNELLGEWINKAWDTTFDKGYGKIKVSDSLVISAYKKLFRDDSSEYYCANKNETSLFNIYNAFTQVITDNKEKDIINNFEKVKVIGDILDVEY